MSEIFTIGDAVGLLGGFAPGDDGLAAKSKELTLQLLAHTESPFSRAQFKPGHITCTALVLHPFSRRVLLMHHHRLRRWLLPGGHVEKRDASLAAAAAREAEEETAVAIDPHFAPFLAGVDVHGIPAKKREPFHLHHDLIWCFRAADEKVEETSEAPQVYWSMESDWDRMKVAESIRRTIRRAGYRA